MRAILALVATAALTIGFALPVAGIGDTQVTLNCDDGTSLTVVVDADGLTALTQAGVRRHRWTAEPRSDRKV